MNKIVVFGAGYVGFSISVLLARKHEVKLIEVVDEKIDMINCGRSPITDSGINSYLESVINSGNLQATKFKEEYILDADCVILALPTNYDEVRKQFDTDILDQELSRVSQLGYSKTIVIKSTIPVGYTDSIVNKFKFCDCFYSPEFLREGNALNDNFHPSRIVVGSKSRGALEFATMMKNASHERSVTTIFTNNETAEIIKLSSNAYLALRVAFFNEIDSYALQKHLNADELISGICADPRIGEGYNNPSFSYGGYCLPKDVQQLSSSFSINGINAPLISSIHASNKTRLNTIIDEIEHRDISSIGIYRVQAKQGSDNYREASNYKILKELVERANLSVKLYEPLINLPSEIKYLTCDSFETFVNSSDLIVANRFATELLPFKEKVFTRDIYNEN